TRSSCPTTRSRAGSDTFGMPASSRARRRAGWPSSTPPASASSCAALIPPGTRRPSSETSSTSSEKLMSLTRNATVVGRVAAAALGLVIASNAAPASEIAQQPAGRAAPKWHTVAGERHGVSYFRVLRFPEVEYEPGDKLTFDRYHTVDVMYHWLRRWAEEYPSIVELYEVGTSFDGRPIL